MGGIGGGRETGSHQLPLQSTVGWMHREPCDTECHAMHPRIYRMTCGTFQGGYSAMTISSRRVLACLIAQQSGLRD